MGIAGVISEDQERSNSNLIGSPACDYEITNTNIVGATSAHNTKFGYPNIFSLIASVCTLPGGQSNSTPSNRQYFAVVLGEIGSQLD